jgi:hypothetical protein
VVLPASDPKGYASVCVWDLLTGKPACCIDPKRAITTLPAFSPDGRILALGHDDGSVSLWELASGEQRCTLTSREMTALTRLAFAPDGKVLAAGDHRTVRFWDLQSGKELATRRGDSLDLMSLALAPDGRTLVSASQDATSLVWDMVGLRPDPVPVALEDRELQTLWDDLAGDAARAFAAMRRLETAPRQAVSLLPRALVAAPLPETRRLGGLLEEFEAHQLTPGSLRGLRVVEMLEQCGTPEARALLEELASGADAVRLTCAARDALRRLAATGQP